MLGQTIARHFAEVFLSSVCSSADSIFYLLRKKKTIFFSFNSGFNSQQILQTNRPVLTTFETGLSRATDRLSSANLQEFRGYDSACPTRKVIGSWQRFLSPGKKKMAVKTAMKRLGNRSDTIKNLC